jgi:small subunit ribosomal protein S3
MMERKFVAQKIKEYQIQEFIDKSLSNVGHSHTVMKKTPLGEKVVIYASRPGLVVGRRGANINDLTKKLKKDFNLENPQIEISEVENIFLDANIVAERIVSSLERFGTNRFKGIGHKVMEKVMESGARGVEIIISGKVPGARARSWRFYQGYVKKCGDAALTAVRKSIRSAQLKPGIVGIRVRIMPPNIRLPDDIQWKDATVEEIAEPKEIKEAKKKTKKRATKKTTKRKTTKKAKKESETSAKTDSEVSKETQEKKPATESVEEKNEE